MRKYSEVCRQIPWAPVAPVKHGNLKADACHAPSWKWTVCRQELSSIIIKSRKDILSSPPCSSADISLHLLAKDKGQRDCLELQVISHCQKITLNMVIPAILLIPLFPAYGKGEKQDLQEKKLPVSASVGEGRGEEKARRTSLLFPKKAETSKQHNAQPITPRDAANLPFPPQEKERGTPHPVTKNNTASGADTSCTALC